MIIKKIINTLTAILLVYAASALAGDQHCISGVGDDRPKTPETAFVDLGDGNVRHQSSGLQWMRCALGQRYSSRRCVDQAAVYTWHEARSAVEQINQSGQFGAYNDWRLPSVAELKTIVETCREAPAINTTIFPDTPSTGFWTLTFRERDDNGRDLHQADHVDPAAPFGAVTDDEELEEMRPEEAWFVGFYKGIEYPYNVDSSYRVRLVRGP